MSAMKHPLRLLALAAICGMFASAAGCSTMDDLRLGAEPPSNAKTTVAVGDRPLTVVTGEPGSSIASTKESPLGLNRLGRNAGKVSGRVYDADGAPVANARVRLAISGALGGKDVQATTDSSGAFTLRGLRPGTTYTVIAEADGSQGKFIGRQQARSSDSNVRISLAPDESSGSGRVRGVSNRTEAADDDGQTVDDGPARIQSGVNEEDIPPAVEAESLPSGGKTSARGQGRTSDPSGKRIGEWERGTVDRPRSSPSREEGATLDPDARGTSATPTTPVEDDEGPNPLPPAIEGPRPRPTPLPEDEPKPSANQEEASVPKTKPRPWPTPAPEPVPAQGAEREPEPFAFDPSHLAALTDVAESKVTTASLPPETTAPAGWPSLASASNDPAPTQVVANEPSNASLPASTADIFGTEPKSVELPSKPNDEVSPPERHRPTWGELTASKTDGKPNYNGFRRIPTVSRTSTKPKQTVERAQVYCDYDDRHKQLTDFALPDLEGKIVRFKDIDADFIVLDFWGTWCAPCLGAIPKLAELQDRMKDKKVVVLGIACERDTPKAAADKVAKLARQMNINYPVLLSGADGNCPLQAALHIQAFPTMILVDRQGRILWRDQGATPTTLARLDRLLTDAVGGTPGKL